MFYIIDESTLNRIIYTFSICIDNIFAIIIYG